MQSQGTTSHLRRNLGLDSLRGPRIILSKIHLHEN